MVAFSWRWGAESWCVSMQFGAKGLVPLGPENKLGPIRDQEANRHCLAGQFLSPAFHAPAALYRLGLGAASEF